ncbi:hypothetical protein [Rickettsia sp. TH2014]|uniref:hypothetical protein n=1 Tax=Rickettsia sp. TH2014 TaxID=1967503 RepID=UPI001C44D177|nr:hypothetical protein [Rickettsia sp. TH2014]
MTLSRFADPRNNALTKNNITIILQSKMNSSILRHNFKKSKESTRRGAAAVVEVKI